MQTWSLVELLRAARPELQSADAAAAAEPELDAAVHKVDVDSGSSGSGSVAQRAHAEAAAVRELGVRKLFKQRAVDARVVLVALQKAQESTHPVQPSKERALHDSIHHELGRQDD